MPKKNIQKSNILENKQVHKVTQNKSTPVEVKKTPVNKETTSQVSDKVRNLPFMVRKAEEKQRKIEEGIKKKILESYQWHYVKLPEEMKQNTSSTQTSESIYRFSYGGFNPKLEELIKARKQWKEGTYTEITTDLNIDPDEVFKRYRTIKRSKKHY